LGGKNDIVFPTDFSPQRLLDWLKNHASLDQTCEHIFLKVGRWSWESKSLGFSGGEFHHG
jgi:hypothetical protein